MQINNEAGRGFAITAGIAALILVLALIVVFFGGRQPSRSAVSPNNLSRTAVAPTKINNSVTQSVKILEPESVQQTVRIR